MSKFPERSQEVMVETLIQCAQQVDAWTGERDAELALNILWMVDDHLVGTRWQRTLFVSERDRAYECPVCGHRHGPDLPEYQAVVVASEEITEESWRSVDNNVAWWIDDEWSLQTRPLGLSSVLHASDA